MLRLAVRRRLRQPSTQFAMQISSSTGHLKFLKLDLADLDSVSKTARSFLASAKSLDVLFNNAGVMHPPEGSVTKQGYELQLGVHNIGTVLFTELLTPLLAQTAARYSAIGIEGCVRVIRVISLTAERSPTGGVDLSNIDYSKTDKSTYTKYNVAKLGSTIRVLSMPKGIRSMRVLSAW